MWFYQHDVQCVVEEPLVPYFCESFFRPCFSASCNTQWRSAPKTDARDTHKWRFWATVESTGQLHAVCCEPPIDRRLIDVRLFFTASFEFLGPVQRPRYNWAYYEDWKSIVNKLRTVFPFTIWGCTLSWSHATGLIYCKAACWMRGAHRLLTKIWVELIYWGTVQGLKEIVLLRNVTNNIRANHERL